MIDLITFDVRQLIDGLKAPATVDAYCTHWAKFRDFAGERDLPLDDSDTLIGWRNHLVKATKESPNTINLRISAIKSVFSELSARKQVQREIFWAMRDVAGVKASVLAKRKKPNAQVRIEPEEMRELVDSPVIELGNPFGARNRALLYVLATSGVRISEAVAIKVADIQKRNGNYLIANILGKGQANTRVAPLSADGYAAIQDWLFVRPVDGDYLFPQIDWLPNGELLYSPDHMSSDAAYKVVKRVCADCGIPNAKPHDFRRFVGTQLAQKDIRIAQKVLGHRNISTTADHYVLDKEPLGSTEGLF